MAKRLFAGIQVLRYLIAQLPPHVYQSLVDAADPDDVPLDAILDYLHAAIEAGASYVLPGICDPTHFTTDICNEIIALPRSIIDAYYASLEADEESSYYRYSSTDCAQRDDTSAIYRMA